MLQKVILKQIKKALIRNKKSYVAIQAKVSRHSSTKFLAPNRFDWPRVPSLKHQFENHYICLQSSKALEFEYTPSKLKSQPKRTISNDDLLMVSKRFVT